MSVKVGINIQKAQVFARLIYPIFPKSQPPVQINLIINRADGILPSTYFIFSDIYILIFVYGIKQIHYLMTRWASSLILFHSKSI